MQKHISTFSCSTKQDFESYMYQMRGDRETTGRPGADQWSWRPELNALHFRSSANVTATGVEMLIGRYAEGDRLDIYIECANLSSQPNEQMRMNVDWSPNADMSNEENIFQVFTTDTSGEFKSTLRSTVLPKDGYYRVRMTLYYGQTGEFLLRNILLTTHTVADYNKTDMIRFTLRKEAGGALNWTQRDEFVQDVPVTLALRNGNAKELLVTYGRKLRGSGKRPMVLTSQEAYWGERVFTKIRNGWQHDVVVQVLDLDGNVLNIADIPTNYHISVLLTN